MLQKAIPRYLRVYSALKSRIESAAFKSGDLLPPEPALEQMFKVSRTTVRKAVEMLAREGMVYVRQGRGTEVLDFRATQKLQFVTSFSETLREQGFRVGYRSVAVRFVAAPIAVASELSLPAGERVARVARIALANGRPIALMTNYLRADIVPGIEKAADRLGSLYFFLESEYGLVIEAATDYLTAKSASPLEARTLRVSAKTPLLVVRRVTFSGGRPVEVALLKIVAERYEYCVHTKDRPPRS
ncbi:MAG: GntR family transcriptional regulator [Planctomycetota bacterium]